MPGVDTSPLVSIVRVGEPDAASTKSCTEALGDCGIRCELIGDDAASWASDPGGTLLRALRSCRGDYVAFWPRQGELDPAALERAVAAFAGHPHAGAVCG